MTSSPAARLVAEALGTACLVLIGTGTVVAAARIGGIPWSLLALAWTVAVLVPVVLFIGVSGAHLNPAVTLALAVSGRIGWRETPLYFLGQTIGAFFGSAVVLAALGDRAHLGANVPEGGAVAASFLGEVAFTGLLVTAVFVLADRGEGRGRWRLLLPPGTVGLGTFVLGEWTGTCSLNPARALAPAVLSGTFVDLWIYLIAVPLGGLLVALVWRPRSVDVEDRGPGRLSTKR